MFANDMKNSQVETQHKVHNHQPRCNEIHVVFRNSLEDQFAPIFILSLFTEVSEQEVSRKENAFKQFEKTRTTNKQRGKKI